jgi:hypothetical protein
MTIGELDRIITVSTLTMSESGGDASESWGVAVSTRAKVTEIDGSRYLKDDELIDKNVLKFEFWDNSYGQNIRIVYDSKTYYPVRPVKKVRDDSYLTICEVIASTKK